MVHPMKSAPETFFCNRSIHHNMSKEKLAGAAATLGGGTVVVGLIAAIKMIVLGGLKGCAHEGGNLVKTAARAVEHSEGVGWRIGNDGVKEAEHSFTGGFRPGEFSGFEKSGPKIGDASEKGIPELPKLKERFPDLFLADPIEKGKPWKQATKELGEKPVAEENWRELRRRSISGLNPPSDSIRRMKLIGLLPDQHAYERVFNTAASERELAEIGRAKAMLERIDNFISLSRDSDGLTVIRGQILDSHEGDLIVIVGHSTDNGAQLVMNDGTRVSVDEIHMLAVKNQRRCLIVTCHSRDLGLETKIDLSEAVEMCQSASETLRAESGREIKMAEISEAMRKTLRTSRIRNTVITGAIWTSGASGGICVVAISNKPLAE